MASKRRVGGSAYNEQVNRIKRAALVTRRSLQRLLDDRPGVQTTAVILARIALEQAAIIEAVNELDRIGKEAKDGRIKR